MKKVLMTSAAANMIWQFNKRNILMLLERGDVEVHIATNFDQPGTIDKDETVRMLEWLRKRKVITHQVDFERGMGSFISNVKVIFQLRRIIKDEKIDLIHTQSPIGSVLTRLANIGQSTKLIYTAHGFHFFKGAPLLYWLVFYPLEYFLSYLVDTLVVINDEDYKRAINFRAGKVKLISGVGVDVRNAIYKAETESYQQNIRWRLRENLGLKETDVVVLNVGELSARKNQIYLLNAVKELKDPHLHVLLAGIGPDEIKLRAFVRDNGLEDKVHFLGYRKDISELHFAADLNVFPSKQEGLALGGLESIVDGLYLLGSNRRGIRDYILSDKIGQTFSLEDDGTELKSQLLQLLAKPRRVPIDEIDSKLMSFDKANIDDVMRQMYGDYLNAE